MVWQGLLSRPECLTASKDRHKTEDWIFRTKSLILGSCFVELPSSCFCSWAHLTRRMVQRSLFSPNNLILHRPRRSTTHGKNTSRQLCSGLVNNPLHKTRPQITNHPGIKTGWKTLGGMTIPILLLESDIYPEPLSLNKIPFMWPCHTTTASIIINTNQKPGAWFLGGIATSQVRDKQSAKDDGFRFIALRPKRSATLNGKTAAHGWQTTLNMFLAKRARKAPKLELMSHLLFVTFSK